MRSPTRALLLFLFVLATASAERPLLNVWEGDTLIREIHQGPGPCLVRERGGKILTRLALPPELQAPAGTLRTLAYLDGVAWAWGTTGVPSTGKAKSRYPRAPFTSADAYMKTIKAQARLEGALRRGILYRSRDFRTWERVALAPLPDPGLNTLHPLRDGSFLALIDGEQPRAERFRITATGLLERVETLPWNLLMGGTMPLLPSWALYCGPDTLLVLAGDHQLTHAVAVDLQTGALRWRDDGKSRPPDHPWSGLQGQRQIGPDGCLIQCFQPSKPKHAYPAAVQRGAGKVISSHLAQRPLSPASRLVAQALMDRLEKGWGNYDRHVQIQALNLRTGRWSPRTRASLNLVSVERVLSLWGVKRRSLRDELGSTFWSTLTFQSDGTSALLLDESTPSPLDALLPWFRP